MKLRPILLLLFCLGTIAVLGWLYYGVTRPALELALSPSEEVLADLDECCRRKHVKAMQYSCYAEVADREREPRAAELFRAMALSERVQEQHGADVIGLLGGHYRPPQRIMIFRGTTAGNLRRSLAHERRSADSLQRSRIERHLRLGNRRCAEALIWAAAADLRHRILLEACCEACDERTEARTGRTGRTDGPDEAVHYSVCPRCGNLYETSACDCYCPHCLTDSRRFIRFVPQPAPHEAVQQTVQQQTAPQTVQQQAAPQHPRRSGQAARLSAPEPAQRKGRL